MKNFYLTTAIDYANGSPHIGHAYEKVLSDVIARHRRLLGVNVHFLTGLDEHGQKVQQGALAEGMEPQERCDLIAEEFIELLEKLLISNDDYLRTTQDRHKRVVRTLLQQLYDRGEIYQAEYSGYYSSRAEQFLQEKDKVDGKWPEIFGEVVEVTESNYFFKLGQYQEWLIDFLSKNDDFIQPEFRRNQVLEFLREPLNDLCISRPRERLEWGISLPFDDRYVTYVWFDALVNYVSAAGFGDEVFDSLWPADLHVIGKDILAPPHSVYWPIMLKALGLPLPKGILVHGWWMISGSKMSKSTGESVNPLELVDLRGADAFRYFVMREMTVGQDADFTLERFDSRYHADLGNDLGNLLSRILNMTARYCEGKVPAATILEKPETDLGNLWDEAHVGARELFNEYKFNLGLERIFVFIRGINRYAEERSPWKLAKSAAVEDRAKLETSLAFIVEAVRLGVALLAPVMPGVNDQVNKLLGISATTLWEEDLVWDHRLAGNTLGPKTILFPRD
ncbi:MAG: methionine--tRNA ligase [Opitutae bacterium]|nr:methionine--tRNA ligase [Opitutae bacterium]